MYPEQPFSRYPERSPFSQYSELSRLVETGEPVCVTFEIEHEVGNEVKNETESKIEIEVENENVSKFGNKVGHGVKKATEAKARGRIANAGEEKSPEKSCLLFCELVQKARMGEEFFVSGQSCSPGDYVLGFSEDSPAAYYLNSGRYKDSKAAESAALSLPRLEKKFCFIRIEPLSLNKGIFDVLILFLKPEKAMRIVQASAYPKGKRAVLDTMGAASICGDCTALAYKQGMGLSFGCKGSRKHSGYEDFEVPLGLSFEKAAEIEEALSKLPDTRE